jgi:hypothetical protein
MGIIPIVLQPEIGDFHSYGYQFVLSEDFSKNQVPDSAKYHEMVRKNANIYKKLEVVAKEGVEKLFQLPQLKLANQQNKSALSPDILEALHSETEKLRLKNQIRQLKDQVNKLDNLLRVSRKEAALLRESVSYRFGVFALYPLRKGRQLFQSVMKDLR